MEFPPHFAPYGLPIWAYFPSADLWSVVTRYELPNGADLWASEEGVLAGGPSKFRLISPAHSNWMQ